MKKEIESTIKEAIAQNWYDEMTTSDLQGACEAKAMGILRKRQVNLNPLLNYQKIFAVSEKILQGIYKHQEAMP
jgi:hypothetical protein